MSDSRVKFVPLHESRLVLFGFWVLALLAYTLLFLEQSDDVGVIPAEANTAACTASCILGGSLFSIFLYNLVSSRKIQASDSGEMKVSSNQFLITFTVTVITHIFVFHYFWMNLWDHNFSTAHPAKEPL